MTPTQSPPYADSQPPAQPRAAAAAVSARTAALLLVLGAVLVAGALAYAFAVWAGPAVWAAPLAAGLGVLVAAIPVLVLGRQLARQPDATAAAAGASALSPHALTRDMFLELAGREWARSRRYGTGAALLLVDVDRFARLAQTHGDGATDTVLASLLEQTAPTLRGADVLVRFAESQMAVFLAPADATGALDVAERIRERAEQLEVMHAPHRLRLTVSVGVAHLRAAHLNLQALVDDAEDALAAARTAGGNCVRAAPVESAQRLTPGRWINNDRARPK